MALSADALTSWEVAQEILSLSDDQQVKTEFLIDAASVYANRRAGRKLRARDGDLRADGQGSNILVLPESPAVVSQLWIDQNRAFADGEELPETDYYVLEEAGIIKLYEKEFPRGTGIVRVLGTFGYDPVPADLVQAVLECVAANLRRLSSGAVGLRTISVDGATSSAYEVDWPTTAVMVFDSYRRPSI